MFRLTAVDTDAFQSTFLYSPEPLFDRVRFQVSSCTKDVEWGTFHTAVEVSRAMSGVRLATDFSSPFALYFFPITHPYTTPCTSKNTTAATKFRIARNGKICSYRVLRRRDSTPSSLECSEDELSVHRHRPQDQRSNNISQPSRDSLPKTPEVIQSRRKTLHTARPNRLVVTYEVQEPKRSRRW